MEPKQHFRTVRSLDSAKDDRRTLLYDVVGARFFVTNVVDHNESYTLFDAWDHVQRHKVRLCLVSSLLTRRDPWMFYSLQRQCVVNARLDHPCIIRALPPTVRQGTLFFIEEYPHGSLLSCLIEKQRTDPHPSWVQCALKIIVSLCEVLQFAHRFTCHGFLHPREIYVQNAGDDEEVPIVRIGHFGLRATLQKVGKGLAGLTSDLTAYAAPEFLSGRALTPSADIYGLGALLYAMLTLQAPQGCFVRPSRLFPEIDASLDRILLKALEDDPAARYQSIEEFAEEVYPFCEARRPPRHGSAYPLRSERRGPLRKEHVRFRASVLAWILLVLINIALLVSILCVRFRAHHAKWSMVQDGHTHEELVEASMCSCTVEYFTPLRSKTPL